MSDRSEILANVYRLRGDERVLPRGENCIRVRRENCISGNFDRRAGNSSVRERIDDELSCAQDSTNRGHTGKRNCEGNVGVGAAPVISMPGEGASSDSQCFAADSLARELI